MSSKKDEHRTTKFAQSCDSRKCRSDNKDQIKKNFIVGIIESYSIKTEIETSTQKDIENIEKNDFDMRREKKDPFITKILKNKHIEINL